MKKKSISIVIPFKNSRETIEKTLKSIYSSSVLPFEVIAVNDHSTDGSEKIVGLFPCILISNDKNYGVSSARNLGASVALGEILFFIDSDIVLKRDTIENLIRFYTENNIDGCVGVLGQDIEFHDFFSQYKNLWMRYTYLLLEGKYPPFYSSVASIKREVFKASGGFMAKYRKPGVEDTVFGNHLLRSGYKIALAKEVEVIHTKRYTLCSLLNTDFSRGRGLVSYFKGKMDIGFFVSCLPKMKDKKITTSVPFFFLLSFVLELIFIFCALLSLGDASLPYVVLLGFLLILAVNLPWLRYLKLEKGIVFSLKSAVFLPLEIFVSILGGVYGLFR